MQDRTLGGQYALSVLPEFPVGANISVDGDRFDAELLGELCDGGIAAGHGCLREAHLCLGQCEFMPPFSSSRPGSFEARDGALTDQFPFKFCQGCKDAKYQPPCSGSGVDLRTLSGQDAQADLAIGKVLHDCHEMFEVAAKAAKAVELPDNQDIAFAQGLETCIEAWPGVTLT